MTRTNITITKTGYTTVTIQTTKIEEDWTNPNLIEILYPRTGTNVSAGKETYLYNLMRLKRVFTISGWLMASDSRTDNQVKDDLVDIINKNTSFTLNIAGYGTGSFEVAFVKCKFTENPVDEGTGGTLAGTSKYEVMLQVTEGTGKI